jgi:hypothetical protein
MSTTPDTLQTHQLEPRRPYKPKTSRKAPATQNAILAKRAAGHSKAKISRDLGISPNTTTSILELNDFDRNLQTEQAQSLSLIPRAIQVAHDRLAKGSENMAIKVLENTIWPLQSKTSGKGDPSLVLAIQNLMGNVQVNQQPQSVTPKVLENPGNSVPVSPVESASVCVPNDTLPSDPAK